MQDHHAKSRKKLVEHSLESTSGKSFHPMNTDIPEHYVQVAYLRSKAMRVQLIHPNAKVPHRQTEGSAGFDLHAIDHIEIRPAERVIVPVGIKVGIPPGFVGLIRDRSSITKKKLIVVAGVIDSDYRDEVGVVFMNLSNLVHHFDQGDRIAQMVVVPYYCSEAFLVESLEETERKGGFGSTGIK